MPHIPDFDVRLARNAADIRAVQALRYRVFVAELGGSGAGVDHAAGLERDAFDTVCDHLLLVDRARPGQPVVGSYRLMRGDQARKVGQFYSASEFDLTALTASGRRLLELGRSCIDPAYRGGTALFELWQALARYVRDTHSDILFGVASFPGTDPDAHAQALTLLATQHAAPRDLRLASRAPVALQRVPVDRLDRVAAARGLPPLLKAYLRLGGFVGEGAFVDHAFNTVDVGVVLDVARMAPRHRALYAADLVP